MQGRSGEGLGWRAGAWAARSARIGSARGVLMRWDHTDFDDGFDDR